MRYRRGPTFEQMVAEMPAVCFGLCSFVVFLWLFRMMAGRESLRFLIGFLLGTGVFFAAYLWDRHMAARVRLRRRFGWLRYVVAAAAIALVGFVRLPAPGYDVEWFDAPKADDLQVEKP